MIEDPDSSDVERFASLVDLPLAEDERERITASIADSLNRFDGYDVFAEDQPDQVDAGTSDPIFVDRPDPHNAFLAQFTLERPDATGQLTGYRLAVKDNISVAGVKLTCGSAALADCVPTRTAPVVRKLLADGVTVVGKTNMDEFAYGATGELGAYGPTRNPVDETRAPGGSSSGSVAAVASDAADIAFGTDTGGSVRMPAAWCGLVGFKPGRGVLSQSGVVDLAPSQDTVGVIAKSSVVVQDVFDSLVDDTTAQTASLSGLRIGVLQDYLTVEGLDNGVASVIEAELDRLESLGATIVPVSTPSLWRIRATANAISTVEFATAFQQGFVPIGSMKEPDVGLSSAISESLANHAEELHPSVKAKIIEGFFYRRATHATPYLRAKDEQCRLEASHADALSTVDVLASPTAPTPAVELGSELTVDPTLFTRAASVCGLPAISIPCGSASDLPVGIQLIGARDADARLLAIAQCVEQTHH